MEELGNQKEIQETTEEVKETVENTAADNVNVSAEQSENKNEDTDAEEKTSILSDILEIAETVIISVFVLLLIFTYIARPVTVEGRSMEPTLDNEDKLIMRTIFYTPKVGDVVIINNEKSYTYQKGTNEIVEGNGLDKRLI